MKEKLVAVIAALSLFIATGLALYCAIGKTEHTIVIDLQDSEDPFEIIPQLLSHNKITSIRAVDRTRNEYKIVVKTHEDKKEILDLILNSKKVEHARIN